MTKCPRECHSWLRIQVMSPTPLLQEGPLESWTHDEALLSPHLQYEAALLPITSLHQGGQGGVLSSGKHASGQIRIALGREQQPTQMTQDLHSERPPRAGAQGGKGAQRGCREGRPLPGARGHQETPQSQLFDGEQGACKLPGVGGSHIVGQRDRGALPRVSDVVAQICGQGSLTCS